MSELETVVSEVEKAAESTVAAVEGEVKKVEGDVATVKADVDKAKAVLVEVATEEKLFLREAELEYVKAQAEIQRLTKITETKSKQYQDYVEGLFKKYALSKAEYVFDGAVNIFKKL
jgi:hypothetical protein